MTDDLGDIDALCDLVDAIHNSSALLEKHNCNSCAKRIIDIWKSTNKAREIAKRIRRHKSDPTTVDEKGQRI